MIHIKLFMYLIIHLVFSCRFNQHSIMVLKACQSQPKSSDGRNDFLNSNGGMMNGNSPEKKGETTKPPSKKVDDYFSD